MARANQCNRTAVPSLLNSYRSLCAANLLQVSAFSAASAVDYTYSESRDRRSAPALTSFHAKLTAFPALLRRRPARRLLLVRQGAWAKAHVHQIAICLPHPRLKHAKPRGV